MFERQQSPVRSSESRAVVKPEQRSSHPRNPLLVQQRALGNQAVQRLILSGTLQAKLRIGQPNDPYEREADRVADTVMKMPEVMTQGTAEASEGGIRTGPLAGAITPVVQRQTEAAPEREEDEDPLRAEPAQAPPAIQRAANGPGITHVRDAALARRLRSPDGGAPLPGNTRNFFERRFGYDFSEVRVHDAYRDGADASTLNARAFTYGSHIWLGHGESTADMRLMAHELTHVVQQGEGVRRTPLVSGSVAPRIQGSWWDSVTEAVGGAISSLGELAGAAKNRVLGQLTEWARRIPGFDLLTVILGRDPISDQPVERNAINLIRGVLGLVPGGTAMFDNLQRAGAIERAFEWFNAEIARLNLTWEIIKGLFRTAWDSLSLGDILDPANAIARVARIFAPPLARLRDFALAAGRKVLEFVFEGVLSLAGSFGTRVLGIIRRAGGLITTIINDPIGFLGNLIRALRGGFERFSANILAHLRTGLLEWLFGALSGAGLSLPDRFDLRGIISIVLQVLGLTYTRLRAKLVDLIGERNVAFIEGVFDFLVTIVTGGLGAAWEKIVEFAGNLQETIIGGIRDWVARTIVGQAITRLVTMFNPVGAVIQGIMTIYNTVVFFIERAQQIAALAEAVFESISNIAAGNLGAAINYVERTMARTLPIIISFLARLIGLGGISDRIKDIIKRIQAPIDRAIDRVAGFIVERVRGMLAGRAEAVGAAGPVPQRPGELQAATEAPFEVEGVSHKVSIEVEGGRARPILSSRPQPVGEFLAYLLQRVTTLPRRQRPQEGEMERARTLIQQIGAYVTLVERQPPQAIASTLLSDIVAALRNLIQIMGNQDMRGANIAVAYYNINGEYRTLASLSGAIPRTSANEVDEFVPGENRFFQTLVLPSSISGRPHLRHNDTEVKVLEYIADRFAPGSGFRNGRPSDRPFRDVRGEVHLTSDFVFCPSCAFVIGQFRRLFPNVQLVAESAENLPPGERDRIRRTRN